MLSNKQIEELLHGFFKEACDVLHIDCNEIKICYGELTIDDWWIYYPENCMVVLNIQKISDAVYNLKYELLRMIMYRFARKVYNSQRYFPLQEEDKKIDEEAFSYALFLLYGINIIRNEKNKLSQKLQQSILQIVNNEFKENCNLLENISKSNPKSTIYYLEKSEAEKDKLRILWMLRRPTLYSLQVKSKEKGTMDNPFENILDACNFLQEEEQKAYYSDTLINTDLAERNFCYNLAKNNYSVPLADSFVAFKKNDYPKGAFIVNHLLSGRFSLKPTLFGKKFLFRGQAEYFEKCTPGLFRDSKKDYFLDDLIKFDELRAIVATHPLVQLLEHGIELWRAFFCFEVNYGGLAQHYYNKTRYLDLTSDLEAAKFFATTDYDRLTDSYRPHLTTDKLGVLYYYEIAMPGAFSPKSNYHLSTIGKQVFMRSGNQHGFLLNMDNGINFNNLPEVRKVFFRHDPKISQQIFKDSHEGSKYFPQDALKEMWKRNMARFENDRSVSLDALKLNVEDNKVCGETEESVMHKLKSLYGIRVDESKKPCFDADLLDQYYEDIKQGWWQDVFCQDIYFAGSDGIIFKDFLLNIPKNPIYKKAFYR